MEIRSSKHVNGVYYVLTKGYIRVQGYGNGEHIIYSQIPDKTKGWLKLIQKEMMEIYNEKFPEKICPVCGKVFKDNSRTFCSPECNHKHAKERAKELQSMPVEAECFVCGKPFTKRRYSERTTCSNECNKILRTSRIKDSWDARMPTPEQKNDVASRKNKKKKSQLNKLVKEANKRGISYGQLQAQKYLEEMRKAT